MKVPLVIGCLRGNEDVAAAGGEGHLRQEAFLPVPVLPGIALSGKEGRADPATLPTTHLGKLCKPRHGCLHDDCKRKAGLVDATGDMSYFPRLPTPWL